MKKGNEGSAASQHHKEVMQFLEDLENIPSTASTAASSSSSSAASSKKAASTIRSSSKAEEVLSFLDELTAAPISRSGSNTGAVRSSTTGSSSPGTAGTTAGAAVGTASTASGSGQSSVMPPKTSKPQQLSTPQRQSQSSYTFTPSMDTEVSEAPAKSAPAAPQQDTSQLAAPATDSTNSSWSWNSLWSTAQATAATVSAATASSLKMAEAMVEETAKAVTSDKVKGLVAEVSTNVSKSVSNVVNKDTLEKMSSDLSKFTINTVHTLSDVLAPPIARSPSSPGSNTARTVAETVTIWLCPQIVDPSLFPAHNNTQQQGEDTKPLPADTDANATAVDRLHDFVQSTANAIWLVSPSSAATTGICHRVIVNSVTDPFPHSASSYEDAVKSAEKTLLRLQKLADANPPSPPTNSHVTVFVILQPFSTTAVSTALPGLSLSPIRQYLALLVRPEQPAPAPPTTEPTAGEEETTAETDQPVSSQKQDTAAAPINSSRLLSPLTLSILTQSVHAKAGSPDNGAGSLANNGPLRKWRNQQVESVIELAVSNLLEEFSLSSVLNQ